MARIDVLPSIDIIRGFKGTLDFYMWRGLPCVRAWPRWRPTRQSDASKNAALLFGAIIKAFSLTHGAVLDQLQIEATGIPRTPRDITVSGIYGRLHEASMSDFLDALIIIRDTVVAQAALLNALHSIDTDELVVRTEHSVLPDGASTAAAQATQLTALQKLDDLQDALQSKALDRLIVRGQDQLISVADSLLHRVPANLTANDGYITDATCPADQIWIVTSIAAKDTTTPLTEWIPVIYDGASNYHIHAERVAIAAAQWKTLQCWKLLQHNDRIRIYFIGGLIGDSCELTVTGFSMTKET